MRRIILVLLSTLFLVFFSGCAQQEQKAEDIDFSFQCKADITFDGQKNTCVFSHSAPGIASVELLSGDLSGLTYFWSGEDFTISYSGLTAKSDECVIPKTSFASVLQQTVDCAQKSGSLTKTHGSEFSGSVGGFDFIIAVDENSGQIQKINVPKYNMVAHFYDYSELGL